LYGITEKDGITYVNIPGMEIDIDNGDMGEEIDMQRAKYSIVRGVSN